VKQSTIPQTRKNRKRPGSAPPRFVCSHSTDYHEILTKLTRFCSLWLSQPEAVVSLSALPSHSLPPCLQSRYSVFGLSYWAAQSGLTSSKCACPAADADLQSCVTIEIDVAPWILK